MHGALTALILSSVCYFTSSQSGKRQILPADSYQVLERAGFRRLGACNYTYAWLTPPPGSSLDAYGHALACTRLQMDNGRLVSGQSRENGPTDQTGTQLEDESSTAEVELGRVDNKLTATMVNLSRLDALMRANEIDIYGTSSDVYPGTLSRKSHLAESNRFFYLADRIRNMNIMAVLRPGQTRSKRIKFEVIDPVSAEHALTPHHVLCSRKQCSVSLSREEIKEQDQPINPKNTTLQLTVALSKTERHSQTIYMQLIVSRVACALLGLLCLVFAVTSLILCTKLRSCQARSRKTVPHSETTIICEPQSPAPCYRINGIGSIGQTTTDHFTDNSLSQSGFVHLPSDTVSLKNVIMSTSSISACEGNYPGNMHYNSVIGHPGPLPPYSLGSNHSTRYGDASGLFTIMPVQPRASIVSNPRSIILPCQNKATSPVPSGPLPSESAPLMYRSESLGRNSRQREGGRRRPLLKPARQINCIRQSGHAGNIMSSDAAPTGPQCLFSQPPELRSPQEWISFNQFPQNTPLLQHVSSETSSPQQKLVFTEYPVSKTFAASTVEQPEYQNRPTQSDVKTFSLPDQ